MRKHVLFLLFSLLSVISYSQTTIPFPAYQVEVDSVTGSSSPYIVYLRVTDLSGNFDGTDITATNFAFWQNCGRYTVDSVLTNFQNEASLRVTDDDSSGRPDLQIGALVQESGGGVGHYIAGVGTDLQQCMSSYYSQFVTGGSSSSSGSEGSCVETVVRSASFAALNVITLKSSGYTVKATGELPDGIVLWSSSDSFAVVNCGIHILTEVIPSTEPDDLAAWRALDGTYYDNNSAGSINTTPPSGWNIKLLTIRGDTLIVGSSFDNLSSSSGSSSVNPDGSFTVYQPSHGFGLSDITEGLSVSESTNLYQLHTAHADSLLPPDAFLLDIPHTDTIVVGKDGVFDKSRYADFSGVADGVAYQTATGTKSNASEKEAIPLFRVEGNNIISMLPKARSTLRVTSIEELKQVDNVALSTIVFLNDKKYMISATNTTGLTPDDIAVVSGIGGANRFAIVEPTSGGTFRLSDFGADVDDSTSDRQAFQNAITLMQNTSYARRLLFDQRGTYDWDNTSVTIDSANFEFIGVDGAVISPDSTTSYTTLITTNQDYFWDNIDVEVKNFAASSADGEDHNSSNVRLLSSTGATNIKIRRSKFTRLDRVVTSSDNENISYSDLQFIDCSTNIHSTDDSTVFYFDILSDRSNITGTSDSSHHIYVDGGYNQSFNTIELVGLGASGSGIRLVAYGPGDTLRRVSFVDVTLNKSDPISVGAKVYDVDITTYKTFDSPILGLNGAESVIKINGLTYNNSTGTSIFGFPNVTASGTGFQLQVSSGSVTGDITLDFHIGLYNFENVSFNDIGHSSAHALRANGNVNVFFNSCSFDRSSVPGSATIRCNNASSTMTFKNTYFNGSGSSYYIIPSNGLTVAENCVIDNLSSLMWPSATTQYYRVKNIKDLAGDYAVDSYVSATNTYTSRGEEVINLSNSGASRLILSTDDRGFNDYEVTILNNTGTRSFISTEGSELINGNDSLILRDLVAVLRTDGTNWYRVDGSRNVENILQVPANAVPESLWNGPEGETFRIDTSNTTSLASADDVVLRQIGSNWVRLYDENDRYNILHFGAVADDNVSDRAAIQLSENFVPDGAVVYFPVGQFDWDNVDVDVNRNNIKFQGVEGSVIHKDSSASLLALFTITDGTDNVDFERLSFTSVPKADASGGSLPQDSNIRPLNFFNDNNDCEVTHCEFYWAEKGIRTSGTQNFVVKDNYFFNCGISGLLQQDTNLIVDNNYSLHQPNYEAIDGKEHHFYINKPTGVVFSNNKLEGIHGAGRSLNLLSESSADTLKNILVIGNTFYNTNGINVPNYNYNTRIAYNSFIVDSIGTAIGSGIGIFGATVGGTVNLVGNEFTRKIPTEGAALSVTGEVTISVTGGTWEGRYETSVNDTSTIIMEGITFLIEPGTGTNLIRKSRSGTLTMKDCYVKYLGAPVEELIRVDNINAFVKISNLTVENNFTTFASLSTVVSGYVSFEDLDVKGFTRVVNSGDDPADFRVINARDWNGDYLPDVKTTLTANANTRGESQLLLGSGITTLTVDTDDIGFNSYEVTIINTTTSEITIATEGSETIDGLTSFKLGGNEKVSLVSNGTNLFTSFYTPLRKKQADITAAGTITPSPGYVYVIDLASTGTITIDESNLRANDFFFIKILDGNTEAVTLDPTGNLIYTTTAGSGTVAISDARKDIMMFYDGTDFVMFSN